MSDMAWEDIKSFWGVVLVILALIFVSLIFFRMTFVNFVDNYEIDRQPAGQEQTREVQSEGDRLVP